MARRGRRLKLSAALLAAAALCLLVLWSAGLLDRLLPGRPAAPRTDLGPRDTLFVLIAANRERSYDQIAALTVAPHAAGLLETLRAVHAFLDEEQRFRNTVTELFGRDFGRTVALTHFAQNLGVFSADVRLLDELITGDTAEVTFLVAETPPAQRATLVRRDGRWQYDPGVGFDPAWPRTFGRMSDALRELRTELASGVRPSASVRADPQAFLRELGARLSAAAGDLPPPGGAAP